MPLLYLFIYRVAIGFTPMFIGFSWRDDVPRVKLSLETGDPFFCFFLGVEFIVSGATCSVYIPQE